MLIIEFFKRIMPTEQNKREHIETQQLSYIIEHSPDPKLKEEDIANYQALCDTIENKGNPSPSIIDRWRACRINAYTYIEDRVRRSWPTGIDELTPDRIREIKQLYGIESPSQEGEAKASPHIGLP